MTITITAKSLSAAAPSICEALKQAPTDTQVWIPSDFSGYWAELKTNPKPAAELTRNELIREMRMYRNPQPYHVRLVPWPQWMYRGLNRGEQSSAL